MLTSTQVDRIVRAQKSFERFLAEVGIEPKFMIGDLFSLTKRPSISFDQNIYALAWMAWQIYTKKHSTNVIVSAYRQDIPAISEEIMDIFERLPRFMRMAYQTMAGGTVLENGSCLFMLTSKDTHNLRGFTINNLILFGFDGYDDLRLEDFLKNYLPCLAPQGSSVILVQYE